MTVEEEVIDVGNYHLAMDGQTWAVLVDHFQDLLPRVGKNFRIFTLGVKEDYLVESIHEVPHGNLLDFTRHAL